MINITNKFSVIATMSGTSMDGLDIAYVQYYRKKEKWQFKLIQAETFFYSKDIKINFIQAYKKELSINFLDEKFGHLISDFIISFIKKHDVSVDLISSHGHTIFHEPMKGFTTQIGSGSIISKRLGLPVVCNFRQQDIDLGGQGAPLVPIGDRLLFSEFDACLNLGGIANISYEKHSSRFAFDICPCNILLNNIANQLGQDFDMDGKLASKGTVDKNLLKSLNEIDYYYSSHPKSLGMEYVDSFFLPILSKVSLNKHDLLATISEHIAVQLSKVFLQLDLNKILVTGGGAFNTNLIARIEKNYMSSLLLPSREIICFKEAIVFGFLGVLRSLKQTNCLSSATGAKRDHSSGDIYLL
ncbi:MAG: anhydro-N-acetylmuramic acid kinase [Flavobacteriales bacterium TMED191]|nr:MAG: anhydro-N-acetylmuramic acid kinase [Flavobacteriales bacterium TMED191]|tara:strand:- start:1493 stop:2560 length:1068 start_codon:yes stop_codon:yes gene_type:complete